MNSSVELLLTVLLIKARFSDDDIMKVSSILKGENPKDPLQGILESLLEITEFRQRSKKEQNNKSDKEKNAAIRYIKIYNNNDQNKHKLLTQFLQMLLDKEILPNNVSLRGFAEHICDKKISTKSSRMDLINMIFRQIHSLPLNNIEHIVKTATNSTKSTKDEYLSLANFIINPDSK